MKPLRPETPEELAWKLTVACSNANANAKLGEENLTLSAFCWDERRLYSPVQKLAVLPFTLPSMAVGNLGSFPSALLR